MNSSRHDNRAFDESCTSDSLRWSLRLDATPGSGAQVKRASLATVTIVADDER
jgi:hypothetical protein